jgi:hypothetical protein
MYVAEHNNLMSPTKHLQVRYAWHTIGEAVAYIRDSTLPKLANVRATHPEGATTTRCYSGVSPMLTTNSHSSVSYSLIDWCKTGMHTPKSPAHVNPNDEDPTRAYATVCQACITSQLPDYPILDALGYCTIGPCIKRQDPRLWETSHYTSPTRSQTYACSNSRLLSAYIVAAAVLYATSHETWGACRYHFLHQNDQSSALLEFSYA